MTARPIACPGQREKRFAGGGSSWGTHGPDRVSGSCSSSASESHTLVSAMCGPIRVEHSHDRAGPTTRARSFCTDWGIPAGRSQVLNSRRGKRESDRGLDCRDRACHQALGGVGAGAGRSSCTRFGRPHEGVRPPDWREAGSFACVRRRRSRARWQNWDIALTAEGTRCSWN